MGEVVNLRRARKAAAREHEQKLAAANRLRHGRRRSDRELEDSRNTKAHRDLDRHRIKTGDER
jgi:hypothetical protein